MRLLTGPRPQPTGRLSCGGGAVVVAVASTAVLFAGCTSDSSSNDETTRDSSGQVVEGGDVGVFALEVGDCVDASSFLDSVAEGDPAEVEQFAAIPCSDPHTGEVILVDDEFFADLDEFPTTENDLYDSAAPACVSALDDYTGTTYESSPYDFASLIPTAESWDAIDDRGLICVGVTLNDALDAPIETSGSIRA